MPGAGENAVPDAALVQGKAEMRAAVVWLILSSSNANAISNSTNTINRASAFAARARLRPRAVPPGRRKPLAAGRQAWAPALVWALAQEAEPFQPANPNPFFPASACCAANLSTASTSVATSAPPIGSLRPFSSRTMARRRFSGFCMRRFSSDAICS